MKREKLSAVFFTQAGVAQIRYNGIDYLLRQYVTASGYGYRKWHKSATTASTICSASMSPPRATAIGIRWPTSGGKDSR